MIRQEQRQYIYDTVSKYFDEAFIYDKGYFVLSESDGVKYGLEYYFSSSGEIRVNYEESRDETVGRIIYVLDCEHMFRHKVHFKSNLFTIKKLLGDYIIGMMSIEDLQEELDVRNLIDRFIPAS